MRTVMIEHQGSPQSLVVRRRGEVRHNRRTSRAVLLLCGLVAWTTGGCNNLLDIPNQSQSVPLETLAASGEPVARLYVAPIETLSFLGTHPWFVVKRADALTFDRWEVSWRLGGPYGYVKKNLREPEENVHSGVPIIWAELVGQEAVDVVEFIEEQSPMYPCSRSYLVFPGPNSNTYAQWVIDQTGWDVELPYNARGKDMPLLCP